MDLPDTARKGSNDYIVERANTFLHTPTWLRTVTRNVFIETGRTSNLRQRLFLDSFSTKIMREIRVMGHNRHVGQWKWALCIRRRSGRKLDGELLPITLVDLSANRVKMWQPTTLSATIEALVRRRLISEPLQTWGFVKICV